MSKKGKSVFLNASATTKDKEDPTNPVRLVLELVDCIEWISWAVFLFSSKTVVNDSLLKP